MKIKEYAAILKEAKWPAFPKALAAACRNIAASAALGAALFGFYMGVQAAVSYAASLI